MTDLLFYSPSRRGGSFALRYAAAVLVALVACATWTPASADDPGTLKVYWKEGIRLDSADKQFQLKIGGRIQNDWDWFTHEDDVETKTGQNADDGTEFRRARLYIPGTMYQHVIFMGEYDFAQGESAFKDVFVGLKEAGPINLIRVGHYKEPFGLEELTSDNITTFMERALPDIFTPQRNVGLSFNQGFFENRMTIAAGTFRDADDITGDSIGDNFQFTGRITGLPVYADEGAQLVHLGFSYSRRNPDDDILRVRQRPEVHRAPRWVDTGDF